MDHERHAGRLEARTGQFRPLRRGRGRQLAAEHVREIDAGLLEHGALAHHARFTATAFGALPGVTPEFTAAVRSFQRSRDGVVQSTQVRDYGGDGRRVVGHVAACLGA